MSAKLASTSAPRVFTLTSIASGRSQTMSTLAVLSSSSINVAASSVVITEVTKTVTSQPSVKSEASTAIISQVSAAITSMGPAATAAIISQIPGAVTSQLSTKPTATTAMISQFANSAASQISTMSTASATQLSSIAATPMAEIGVQDATAIGPFAPTVAILGGIPTAGLDVPITAIFLVLFLIGAATHFITHELNGKRGHKFHLSDMVFDFCMVRTVTCILRIAWAFKPENSSLVLAALIFENAGVVVLFAVNGFFTMRILRATHPKMGWNPTVAQIFAVFLISIVFIVIFNIVVLVASFFTLDRNALGVIFRLQLFGATYTTFLGFLPIPIVFLATTIPANKPVEKFGSGRFRTKCVLLMYASTVLTLGAVIRLAAAASQRTIEDAGEINSKALFYTTGFMLEISVVALYAVARVDLRFHVPDGSCGPGDYSRGDHKNDDNLPGFDANDLQEKFDSGSQLAPGLEDVKRTVNTISIGNDVFGYAIPTGDPNLLLYLFRNGNSGSPGISAPGSFQRKSVWNNDI